MSGGSTDLGDIHIASGVNERGEGFCTVTASSRDGRVILVGQLSPAEVRQHALAYLEAAEGAEQDAAALRVIRTLELPDELAGAIIIELRNSRA